MPDTQAVPVLDRAVLARLEEEARQWAAVGSLTSGAERSKPWKRGGEPDRLGELLAGLEARRLSETPAARAEREAANREREAEAERKRQASLRRRIARCLDESGIPGERGGWKALRSYGHQREAVQALGELLAEFRAGRWNWWGVLHGMRGRQADNPGANGIGKTALAAAFGVECCRAGHTVAFHTETELVRSLYRCLSQRGEGSLWDRVERLQHVSLLILDNMGTDSDLRRDGQVRQVSDFAREQLFDILNGRMESRPVILTTNLEPDLFEERFGHDIYSRVYGMAARRDAWLSFTGPDLRKEWRG